MEDIDDDVAALAQVLDPDVAGWATLYGGDVGFAQGAEAVAGRLLLFLGPHSGWELSPLELENDAVVLATRHAEPVALLRLMMVAGDRVQTIRTGSCPADRARRTGLPVMQESGDWHSGQGPVRLVRAEGRARRSAVTRQGQP